MCGKPPKQSQDETEGSSSSEPLNTLSLHVGCVRGLSWLIGNCLLSGDQTKSVKQTWEEGNVRGFVVVCLFFGLFLGCYCKTPETGGSPLKSQDELAGTPITREKT